MKQILLPTDFSKNARHSHNYAISLFGPDATYTLVNAIHEPHASSGMLKSIDHILKQDSVKGLEKELGIMEAEWAGKNITFKTHSEFGDPSEVLQRFVKRGEADFVVMGTTGASGLKELLIGSNAADVIKSVQCPVIAVPIHAPLTDPKKIVLASDMASIKHTEVLQPLVNIGKRYNSHIMVLHVSKDGERAADSDNTQIGTLLQGLEYSFHVVMNEDAVTGIDDFSNENEADMLVMIPRTLGFFEGLFHRSVTHKMAMHADMPLLSIRD